MKRSTLVYTAIASLAAGMLAQPPARADDIDIFTGNSATPVDAPNVIFYLDNTSNWSKNDQGFTDQSSEGKMEVDAIVRILTKFNTDKTANSAKPSFNVGVAQETPVQGATPVCRNASGVTPASSGCVGGGYIRFGVRNVTDGSNGLKNLKGLANLLGYGPTTPAPLTAAAPATSFYNDITNSANKINESSKDENAVLSEIYRYFKSQKSLFGIPATLIPNSSVGHDWDDYPNCENSAYTTRGLNVDSNWAMNNDGSQYTGPSTSCSRNYIIYIVNNSKGSQISTGSQKYGDGTVANTLSAGKWVDTSKASCTSCVGGWSSWTAAWVKFLASKGIVTYIVDVYNPPKGLFNAPYSNALQVAANQAGVGQHYYQVGSEVDLGNALSGIFDDIQSVNSAFAAASLPASATNRSVDQNEVFLGVFRPDANAAPRWYGNLKRYKLILTSGGSPDLGDVAGNPAVDSGTGFLKNCISSFWTFDTTAYQPTGGTPPLGAPYWDGVSGDDPLSAQSQCLTLPTGVLAGSDKPDGPSVEKGGVGEQLRKGNTNATNDWKVHRKITTLDSAGTLTDFTATTNTVSLSALGAPSTARLENIVDYISGWDSNDENTNGYINPNTSPASTTTETRSTIHGDVIHSTPLPVTYDTSATGVLTFYGSNDGFFHAVQANDGTEVWSFIAPEFFPWMYRLYKDTPQILYPPMVGQSITPAPQSKNYGFDGPTGIYRNTSGSQVWIYPSMRRGGRMIYAFDVSPVSGAPPTKTDIKYLWKAGCPDLGDNSNCTPGFTDGKIGQTWSTPQTGLIKDSTTTPVLPYVVVGGGYDSTPTSADSRTYTSCEDQNRTAPPCSTRTGNVVYIMDAQHGQSTFLKTLTLPNTHGTPGSVVGDVALLDANNDGYIDYAYFGDTNGFVYRIDFVSSPTTFTALASSNWAITQIAGTRDTTNPRKFEYAPTLFFNQNKVYVGLGSGDREHPLITQYPFTSPVKNRFYVFIDDPVHTDRYVNLDDTSGSTIGGAMHNSTSSASTTCSTAPVLPANTDLAASSTTPVGWFKDLNTEGKCGTQGKGEQVVTPAVIVSGQISWGTNCPVPQDPSADACQNNLGEARGYLADLINGACSIGITGVCSDTGGNACSATYAGGGLPPPPSVGVVQVPDANGNPTYQGVCLGCPPKSGGTGSTIQPGNPFATNLENRRRVYWFTPDQQ